MLCPEHQLGSLELCADRQRPRYPDTDILSSLMGETILVLERWSEILWLGLKSLSKKLNPNFNVCFVSVFTIIMGSSFILYRNLKFISIIQRFKGPSNT